MVVVAVEQHQPQVVMELLAVQVEPLVEVEEVVELVQVPQV